MALYKITIELNTDNGNPAKWNWAELLDEFEVLNVDVEESY